MKKILIAILIAIASITYATAINHTEIDYDDKPVIENINNIEIGFPMTLSICESDSFHIYINSISDYKDEIKYELKNSTLYFWIDNSTIDVLELNSKFTRITIMTPQNNIKQIKINTLNSNLQVTSKEQKKKNLANYENN